MSEAVVEVGKLTQEDILPSIELRYTDLYYSVMRVEAEAKRQVPNAAQMILSVALFPIAVPLRIIMAKRQQQLAAAANTSTSSGAGGAPNKKTEFVILDKVSGVIRPGTLTLVLSPPGHGKSAFLKAITQRLPPKVLQGNITYSGISPNDASSHGLHIGQLVQYVSQLDEHLPWLTVKETYSFVHANACLDEGKYSVDPALCGGVPNTKRVEDMINMLGMSNCENTVVGDALLRGISGGEKKRVTVGEGLLTNARVLCLDEPSTGLDSAVTFTIINSLRLRAERNGLAVVISLLQPTPEVYDLFDEVILLREGAVVYHGPRTALPEYLTNLGFNPPVPVTKDSSVTTVPSPVLSSVSSTAVHMDMADYLVELITDPLRMWRKAVKEKTNPLTATIGTPPVTTAVLANAWKLSKLFDHQMNSKPSTAPLSLVHPFSKAQYSRNYAHNIFYHIRLLLLRQFKLMGRNRLYVRSRLSSSMFMSFLLGGLYFQRTIDQALTFFGLFLNGNMVMGFSNLAEMSAVVESKFIAQKHVANGTFPPFAYVLAGMIAHLPVAAIETLIFTSILYFMAGMAPSAANYFFFYFVILLTNIFFRNLMATFAYLGKSLQAAQAMPLPIISLLIVFAGFLITKDKMSWLQFMSYIDVFSYAVRSIAQNEFFHERYGARPAGPNGPTLGELYLKAFGFDTDDYWKWSGIGFQFGCIALVVFTAFYAFASLRFDRNVGSARIAPKHHHHALSASVPNAQSPVMTGSTSSSNTVPQLALGDKAIKTETDPTIDELSDGDSETDTPDSENKTPADVVQTPGFVNPSVTNINLPAPGTPPLRSVSNEGIDHSSVLPFEPMTVAFKDITYVVSLPPHLGGGEKTLLRGISGYALPGRMIALMGASGAGKTTLLDVLGGRKNSGKMNGLITLNGHPKENASFARITAYVEQTDIHVPLATVRESLQFSAALRLPSSVTSKQRHDFVEQVLELLELTPIADRLVGQPNTSDGLAPGERKRLTIGVELVSNAPVIFLDEPTSGLDARAAAIVMRVVRRITSMGRTVICTIHQPSAELFFMFDDLLLLQRGGYQVYFGPLGFRGSDMIKYLESIPGMTKRPHGMNPASWMLDSLAGTDSSVAGKIIVPSMNDNQQVPSKSSATAVKPDTEGSFQVNNPITPHTAAIKEATGNQVLEGKPLQDHLMASDLWKKTEALLTTYVTPAPGTSPVRFASRYPINFVRQSLVLINRTWYTYMRNIGLNFGRFMALTVIGFIFGIVFQGIYQDAYDQSGVQSLVSAVFMGAAFSAMIMMNVSVPAILAGRTVFYREQASGMYNPNAHNIALITVELPWVTGITLLTLPITYFLYGLNSSPESFFFYWFAVLVLALVYISLGQFLAFTAPTFEVAQALLGVIGPLFFLFGGLWSPPSGMVPGARWFTYLDPVYYAFRALIPPQFWCEGTDCPKISMVTPQGIVQIDRYVYVRDRYEFHYEEVWENVGYLAIFIAVFQCFAMISTRYVRHIVR